MNSDPFVLAGLQGGTAQILLPLSLHAQNTLRSLGNTHAHSVLMVSPFCHEQQEGAHEVRGWCLDTPGHAPGSALPINCSLFDGVSIVRCDCTESEILELLSNAEDTRRRLGAAMDRIMQAGLVLSEDDDDLRASWKRCRPTANGIPRSLCSATIAVESNAKKGNNVHFFNSEDCVPLIDSEPWIPELSPDGFIGLYHHWNYDDSRAHMVDAKGPALYMVCQSYLPKACLEFADMVRDLGEACTASEIFHSEEAFWLRQACSRNRSRLIARVCHDMGIKCPSMLDYNACKQAGAMFLAMPAVETLHHDLQCIRPKNGGAAERGQEVIRVLNFCANGSNSACVMAPWDGLWVFHGDRTPSSLSPTITPQIAEQDFRELKQKKQSEQVLFSSKIPTSCDILNVFVIGKKKGADKQQKKKKKGQRDSVNKPSPLLLAQDLLGSLEEMQYHSVSPADMQLMAVPPSLKAVDDPDILAAYKRSVAKMAALALNNPKTDVNKQQKKKTYLTFNEHVLQAMEHQGWKRSKGYTVLIPLACGLSDIWRQKWEDGSLLAQ